MTKDKKITAGVYTIAATRPFLKDLAQGLLTCVAQNVSDLASMTVYLPNRRSSRVFADELLKASKQEVLVLPKIFTLGDLDEEWQIFEEAPSTIPQPISVTRRYVLLSELIQKYDASINRYQSLSLAKELSRFLDEMHIQGVTFDKLEKLVPEELSQHWQRTLDFLKIISEHWPKILAEENQVDPAKYRRLVVEALINKWQTDPPQGPIIAAGSTGSQPITAILLNAIRQLPQGVVILPGLDQDMAANEWDQLTETHPQYHMKKLLTFLQLSRDNVHPWREETAKPSRERLLREMMRPAFATDQWPLLKDFTVNELKDISLINCDDEQHEADTIALLLREGWEDNKTTALITPDRAIAVRVRAALRRWNIFVDDSGGTPLPQTSLGRLMIGIAHLADHPDDVVALISLVKHSLYRKSSEQSATQLDLALRGPRPGINMQGVKRVLHLKNYPELIPVIDELEGLLQPIIDAKTFADKWQAHLKAIRQLTIALDEEDELLLESIVDKFAEAPNFLIQNEDDYEDVFTNLIEDDVSRAVFKSDAKVYIWGVLESRLMTADKVILAGLNEGTWPPEAGADPWLNRPMRREIALMPHDRRVGQTAHDFIGLFSAPEVIMTRSLKKAGTPTIAARWLEKLDALMTMKGDKTHLNSKNDMAAYAKILDHVDSIKPIDPPLVKTTVSQRPTTLSVSTLESFLSDPYTLYAKEILKLKHLRELDEDPTVADRGTIIHRILEKIVMHNLQNIDDVLQIADKELFALKETYPMIYEIWRPRVHKMLVHFLTEEALRRADIDKTFTEKNAKWNVKGSTRQYTITAKADRIDVLKNKTVEVIDYKTGTVPIFPEMVSGEAPQLPIEGVMIEEGLFDGVAAVKNPALSFWRLSHRTAQAEKITYTDDKIEGLLHLTRNGIKGLLEILDDPATLFYASPLPDYAQQYNDYIHLSRLKEWIAS